MKLYNSDYITEELARWNVSFCYLFWIKYLIALSVHERCSKIENDINKKDKIETVFKDRESSSFKSFRFERNFKRNQKHVNNIENSNCQIPVNPQPTLISNYKPPLLILKLNIQFTILVLIVLLLVYYILCPKVFNCFLIYMFRLLLLLKLLYIMY
jgi:hypothetical protein